MIAELIPGKGVDLLRDGLGLPEAAKLLRGARGKPASADVVRRWITVGVRIPGSQERLRLRASLVGGEWLTLPQWIREFERKRLELGEYKPPERIERPARERKAAVKHAQKQLERHGIKPRQAPTQ